MSQRGIIFHQLDERGREWAMNGFVPPLVMDLNVDTLQWCMEPLPPEYPEKVRTYAMTNDRYLLKTCWTGPFVKMSHWLDNETMPMVYGPIAGRMESAGNMLKNLYEYFNTHDVLYAADFDPNLSTDLTFVQVAKHTAATFKMETPMDLNDPKHKEQSCIFAETDTNETEFYNPIYDNGMAGFGYPGRTPETVTVNSRILSDNFCAGDSTTLKDTLSRIPSEMNERMYNAIMKMKEDYRKMGNVYYRNGVVPKNLPGVLQPQQAAQAANANHLSVGHSHNNATNTRLMVTLPPENIENQSNDGEEINDNNHAGEQYDRQNQEQSLLYHSTERPGNDLLPVG